MIPDLPARRLPRPTLRRAPIVLAAVAVLAVASIGPAAAHVTIDPSEAPAGGYGTIHFSVPHGCGAEPTEELSVQLPPSVRSTTAQAVPGWEVSYETEEIDEAPETLTEYISVVTWTAVDEPLAADQFLTFGISARWPDDPGDTLLIPAIQRCTDGSESAWIDPDSSADYPAPTVRLAERGHGHSHRHDEDGGHSHDDDEGSHSHDDDDAAGTSGSGSGGDSGVDGLAVGALVVALLAFATAGAAFFTGRRDSPGRSGAG